MPEYDGHIASKIVIDMMAEVDNADDVTVEMPNHMYLYDEATGDKYQLGIKNGLMYYKKIEE
jgi:hypothetical protein